MKKTDVKQALSYVLNRIDKNLEDFTYKFPGNQSKGYVYRQTDCTDWTEGFWTGMLHMAFELTKDEKYKKATSIHTKIFSDRIHNKIGIDTHDLGFLYSLSCVAAYKLHRDDTAKQAAIGAAKLLMSRYRPEGEFIQAWGRLDDKNNYRLIIDCLMNLPLLYWVADVTGDEQYRTAAEKHLHTTIKNAIRSDCTTHHTFYFDPNTGEPAGGKTHQGFSDDSCWARGQAWAIYGLALSYSYTQDENLPSLFNKVCDVFLSKLPKDNVPYWDMVFTDGSGEPRDTSAAAIACCGIMEMNRSHPNSEYMEKADAMLYSLTQNYTTKKIIGSNGILSDSMYNRNNGDNPECSIWGDYFYMEALMRSLNPDWQMYW